MKQTVFFFLGIILIGSLLAGCASAATPAVVEPTAGAATAPAAAPPTTATVEGCLGTAEAAVVDLNCQEVRIAVENAYLPFNYVLASSGQADGWDYRAWAELCTRLHCKPVFVEAAWDGLIQSVSDGQFDVGADGITNTPERAKVVDFSSGYIQIQQRLLVRKGETRIKSIQDIVDNPALVLGTQANTTNYETAKKYLSEERIRAFEQFPFAVQALIGGDLDAVIIDAVAGQGYQGENADKLDLIGNAISSDELGFIFPKGSKLLEPVNKALAAMQQDGSLQKLNDQFFGPNFKVSGSDIK